MNAKKNTILGLMAISQLLLVGQVFASTQGAPPVDPLPKFEVASNGTTYTKLVLPELANYIHFLIQIDNGGTVGKRVKSWNVIPQLDFPSTASILLNNYKVSKSYGIGKRPKKINKKVSTPAIPANIYETQMKNACNALADQLRSQGKSNKQIFAQDRKIDINIKSNLKVNWTKEKDSLNTGSVGGSQTAKTTLTCKKWSGSQVDTAGGLTAAMKVNSAKLNIPASWKKKTVQGCPVSTKVPVTAVIETTGKGTVKFRLRSAKTGYKTSLYTLKITDKTLGKWTGKKTIQIPVPVPVVGGGSSGGGGVGATAAGGFASPTKGDDGIPTTGGARPKGPGSFAAPTDKNIYSESFRIETVSPNKVNSEYNGFIIKCIPKTPAVGGSGKVAPAAKPSTSKGPVAGAASKVASKGKPDIMMTTLGMNLGTGNVGFMKNGSSSTMTNSGDAIVGQGPKGDMCKFPKVRFRPFNKGSVKTGPFKTQILVNNKVVKTKTFLNLKPKSGLPLNDGWFQFSLLLKEGVNQIKVKLDSANKVSESNEKNNIFNAKVKLNLSCKKAGAGPKPGSRLNSKSIKLNK